MSGALAVAARVLFNDPNGSVTGVYTAPGGQPLPVRVLRVAATDAVAGSTAQFGNQAGQARAELLVGEVPVQPAKGALLAFEGRVYRLSGPAAPSRNGLTWSMALGDA